MKIPMKVKSKSVDCSKPPRCAGERNPSAAKIKVTTDIPSTCTSLGVPLILEYLYYSRVHAMSFKVFSPHPTTSISIPQLVDLFFLPKSHAPKKLSVHLRRRCTETIINSTCRRRTLKPYMVRNAFCLGSGEGNTWSNVCEHFRLALIMLSESGSA